MQVFLPLGTQIVIQSVDTQEFLKISPWKYQRKSSKFKNPSAKTQLLLGNFGMTYISSLAPNAFRRLACPWIPFHLGSDTKLLPSWRLTYRVPSLLGTLPLKLKGLCQKCWHNPELWVSGRIVSWELFEPVFCLILGWGRIKDWFSISSFIHWKGLEDKTPELCKDRCNVVKRVKGLKKIR